MNLIHEIFGYPQDRLTPTNFFVTKGENVFGEPAKMFNSVFKIGRKKFVFVLSTTRKDSNKILKSIEYAQTLLSDEIKQYGHPFSNVVERRRKHIFGQLQVLNMLPDIVCNVWGIEFQIVTDFKWYNCYGFQNNIQELLSERAFSVLEFIKISQL